jgi:type IV secretion system protein VirD4
VSSQNSNTKAKVLFLGILFIAAVAAGLYLSGYIVLLQLKLRGTELHWNTWWNYFRVIDEAQVLPYAKKIKISGAIGFGLTIGGWLALTVMALIPRQRALHGDARFATGGDLAEKGMFKPHGNGIVVGKFGGKIVRLGGQQFVILAAPTRSGKGVGIVIPNLLDYQESMVVLDIKQENFDLTSG